MSTLLSLSSAVEPCSVGGCEVVVAASAEFELAHAGGHTCRAVATVVTVMFLARRAGRRSAYCGTSSDRSARRRPAGRHVSALDRRPSCSNPWRGARRGTRGCGRRWSSDSSRSGARRCWPAVPPRESRCRSMRPELTGIGAVPHNAAKEAEERSRSGLSSAVISSWAPMTRPMPLTASSPGLAAAARVSIRCSRSAISSPSRRCRPVTAARAGCPRRQGRGPGRGGCRSVRQGVRLGRVAIAVPQLAGRVDQERPDLTPRRLLRLDRGSAGDGQRPQRFDAGPLRVGGGFPDGTDQGRAVGVEAVGLALLAPLRGRVRLTSTTRIPAVVTAAAIPTPWLLVPSIPTVCGGPCSISQATASAVTGGRGRELPIGHRLTEPGDDRDVDGVLVRVDPADMLLLVCHDGDALPIRWVGTGRTGQTGHTPGPGTGQARIRSCPTSRCRDSASPGAGRIGPSATRQGASQMSAHDPRAAIRV